MAKSNDLRADDSGQVIGISHHDGQIRGISFERGEQIDLLIVSSSGEEKKVLLLGVEYFTLNNLKEGNIIDRMYLWDLKKTPSAIMHRMLQALVIGSIDLLTKKFGDGVQVFHLECSYGAELFAVVRKAVTEPA